MIVIEETGLSDGKGFNIYMAGDKERLQQTPRIAEDDMSPAEFWGMKLFSIVGNIVVRTGACDQVVDLNDIPSRTN